MLLSTGIVQPPISQLCAFDSFAQCGTLCLEAAIWTQLPFSVFVNVLPCICFLSCDVLTSADTILQGNSLEQLPQPFALSHPVASPVFPSSLASALLSPPLLAARRLPFVLSSFICPR